MKLHTTVAAFSGFVLALVAGSGPLNPPAGPVVATGATLDAIMAAVTGLQQQMPPRAETAPSLLPALPVAPVTMTLTRESLPEVPPLDVPILGWRSEQLVTTSGPNNNQYFRTVVVVTLDGHNFVDGTPTGDTRVTVHTGCPFTISGQPMLQRTNTVQRADGTINVLYELVLDSVVFVPLAP